MNARFAFMLWLLVSALPATRSWANSKGRYGDLYVHEVEPLLKLPPKVEKGQTRATLRQLLEQPDLPELLRYVAKRQLLFLSEYEDRPTFLEQVRQITPKPDDYLLQATVALYDTNLAYPQLVEKLEHNFNMALETEPNSNIAGWIALDALSIMTDHYDFARATQLLRRATETLPQDEQVLRSLLMQSIARLYVDPGNTQEVIQQGLKIYAESESLMRRLGQTNEASNSAYNQGVGILFAFHNDQKALEHFARVDRASIYGQDALIFSALAQAHLGLKNQARATLASLHLEGYIDPARLSFLQCYLQIVRSRIAEKADLNLCTHLPNETQVDVIQHMTDEILQLPLPPGMEAAVLKQFQNFYRNKIYPQNKLRMGQSVDSLELARARAESERSRYESKISRVELDLAQKQSQLTAYGALSMVIVLCLIGFVFWRTKAEQQKLQKLQQYVQTRILQRFLPPTLVDEILLGRSRLEEAPQKKLVTILFADLVGFTAKAEQLGSERTAELLNQWLRLATDVVFKENGTIDKFIGDGVMVIYGAPLDIAPRDQVERAVACARSLVSTMEKQNTIWEGEYGVRFQLRVGINLGEAIVGSFGSEKRSDYTVIGSAVNFASRIEHIAEPGQILLSRTAAEYLPGSEVESVGIKQMRGIQGVHELFAVKVDRLQAAG